MMMRMSSTVGGSCEVQVQRGFVEVMDVGHSGAGASLSSSPKGAYTVTRSNSDGSTILLWRRHMKRLAQSMLLLAEAIPSKFPEPPASISTLGTPHLSISSGRSCRALELRKPAEEICISILAYRNEEFESHSKKRLGCQDLPLAKYSLWVDTNRILEQPKPVSASEIILSDDGDLLEGSMTNFFVVAESRACNSKERCSHRKQQQGFEVAESRDCNSEERSGHIKQLEGIEVADSKDCHNYKERRESRSQ